MSKKKRKRLEKRRLAVQAAMPPKEQVKEIKRESTALKSRKKAYYLIPLLSIIVAASLIFYFSRGKYKVRKTSDLNVLFITLDTTRADRIGCYGYQRAKTPSLDTLARNGVMFSNTYCPVPMTLPSHCSLFTGTYPLYHHVHNNGFYYLRPEYITLAEILKENGFKTAAFVSSFSVDSRFGLDQGFEIYDDTFNDEEIFKNFMSERRADRVSESFWRWLDANSQEKFFCWLHYYDPHLPYNPPSPFKEDFSERPYDGEIAYMDSYIGKTIEKLREKNILEKTLVILVGDHGEALGEKNEIDHGLFLYENTLKVPLIFYSEKSLPKGLVIDSRVRLIDIMPTLLDLLNVPLGDEIQGLSLVSYLKGKKKTDLPSYIETYTPRENYGWSELVGLLDSPWKYIKAPKPELYNLLQDPQEERNLIRKEEKVVASLADKLKTAIQDFSSSRQTGKKKLTFEEQERLRALGYLGGEPSEESSQKPLPDPKDKTSEYSILVYARKYEYEGNYERAAEYYKEVIKLSPEVAWNYVYLALIYRKMNKIQDAIQILEEGKKMIPNSLVILSRLSNFYLRGGRLKEALETSQAVLKFDPQYFDALYVSGLALANLGKWIDSLDYFERALEIEPENKSLQLQYAYSLAANGRGADALKIYEKLKKQYPGDYQIYQDLAIVYDFLGDLKSARQNLQHAIELNPSFETYFNYAILLGKMNDFKEAIHYLKLYLDTTPEVNSPRKIQAQKVLSEWESRLR